MHNSHVESEGAADIPKTSRRSFIKQVSLASATLAVGAGCSILPSDRKRLALAPTVTPRMDKLRLAYIGVNGIGGYHLDKTREMGVVWASR